MLKSVGVVLSPVKMGVNTLEKPTPEIIKPNHSNNNIDLTKKSWKFFKKSKSKLNLCDSNTNIIAPSEIKPQRILVDQEQQYDENDIPQCFQYEEKRLSYHPSQNLPSTSSNESYNSSTTSTSFNKEKSRSCDVVFLNSQDPCYIQDESSSPTVQNEQIKLNNINYNRNSLIFRDSLRNRIKIEISYNPTTINNNFDDDYDDTDDLSFVTAATSSNFRRNYRSNENGETILNINGFNDCDVSKRNSIASNCDTSSNKNFMRRKLTTQSRTLLPLTNSELAKEEWIQLEDDEFKENNHSNQVNINLVNPFTSAPNKSTNVVTINLNPPPSKVQSIGLRKSQISLQQNSQPLNRSPTLQSVSNSTISEQQRSHSTLENHRKHTPDLLSSRIDLFSILNRRDDPLFDPSRNSGSSQDDNSGKNYKFKKNSELKYNQRNFGSNIYSNNKINTSTNATKRNSGSFFQNTLCDRLSGSFQNLSNKIKVNTKKMSASESNLVKLQQQELNKKSSKTNNMRHSDTLSKRNINSKTRNVNNDNSLTATWRKFLPKIFKTKRVKSGRE